MEDEDNGTTHPPAAAVPKKQPQQRPYQQKSIFLGVVIPVRSSKQATRPILSPQQEEPAPHRAEPAPSPTPDPLSSPLPVASFCSESEADDDSDDDYIFAPLPPTITPRSLVRNTVQSSLSSAEQIHGVGINTVSLLPLSLSNSQLTLDWIAPGKTLQASASQSSTKLGRDGLAVAITKPKRAMSEESGYSWNNGTLSKPTTSRGNPSHRLNPKDGDDPSTTLPTPTATTPPHSSSWSSASPPPPNTASASSGVPRVQFKVEVPRGVYKASSHAPASSFASTSSPQPIVPKSIKIKLAGLNSLPSDLPGTCHHDKYVYALHFHLLWGFEANHVLSPSYTPEGESVFILNGSFECPVCRDICKCAKCRRTRGEIGEPARRKKEDFDAATLRPKKIRKTSPDSNGSGSDWSDQGEDVVKRGKKRRIDPGWETSTASERRASDSNSHPKDDLAFQWIPASDGMRWKGKERAWSDAGSSHDEDDEGWSEDEELRALRPITLSLDELPIGIPEPTPVVWHEGPARRRRWETPEEVDMEEVGLALDPVTVEAAFDDLLSELEAKHSRPSTSDEISLPFSLPFSSSFETLFDESNYSSRHNSPSSEQSELSGTLTLPSSHVVDLLESSTLFQISSLSSTFLSTPQTSRGKLAKLARSSSPKRTCPFGSVQRGSNRIPTLYIPSPEQSTPASSSSEVETESIVDPEILPEATDDDQSSLPSFASNRSPSPPTTSESNTPPSNESLDGALREIFLASPASNLEEDPFRWIASPSTLNLKAPPSVNPSPSSSNPSATTVPTPVANRSPTATVTKPSPSAKTWTSSLWNASMNTLFASRSESSVSPNRSSSPLLMPVAPVAEAPSIAPSYWKGTGSVRGAGGPTRGWEYSPVDYSELNYHYYGVDPMHYGEGGIGNAT